MQDAGFITGEALIDEWRARLHRRSGVTSAARLDARWFGPLFGEVCTALGWGALEVEPIGEQAILFRAADWYESEPDSTEHPGCYFTCGCLAAFLTAQAGAPIAILEVECRSCGDTECRFVAGSAETLAAVYDIVAAGGPWRAAFDPAVPVADGAGDAH
jgi:hypothetical protein